MTGSRLVRLEITMRLRADRQTIGFRTKSPEAWMDKAGEVPSVRAGVPLVPFQKKNDMVVIEGDFVLGLRFVRSKNRSG